jgi:hypothetical protein
MRSDVRLDDYNQMQFDRTVDYLMHHPLAGSMEFKTVSAHLDQLDLIAQ